jgi:hypothetical protein
VLISLNLANVGPADHMDIDFGSRVNLFTGDNGLGKSFLLDTAWWALTRRWPRVVNPRLTSGYAARPTNPKKPATISFAVSSKSRTVSYQSHYSPRDEAWVGEAGRPANPGLVIYAHADGGFSVWDPARNYWKKKGNIDVQERLPAYVFSAQEVWDGLRVNVGGVETSVCNGLLQDWVSWIGQRPNDDALYMDAALFHLSPAGTAGQLHTGPLARLSINEGRDIPTINTDYANAVPIVHASAGVRRIVALAYMLVWTWREHGIACRLLGEETTRQVVLLFDEIESHLHPRWQRSILASLLKLSGLMHKKASIQIIAATHSPLVLASAEPFFDPKQDAWFDLDLKPQAKGASVQLTRREFVRHGSVADWLTSDAFDLQEPRSLEAEQAIQQAREMFSKGTLHASEIKKVDKALRAALGDTDRFWVRWSQFRDAKGLRS